jgi:hypothetical protein
MKNYEKTIFEYLVGRFGETKGANRGYANCTMAQIFDKLSCEYQAKVIYDAAVRGEVRVDSPLFKLADPKTGLFFDKENKLYYGMTVLSADTPSGKMRFLPLFYAGDE